MPGWLVILNRNQADVDSFAAATFDWLLLAAPLPRRRALRRLWQLLLGMLCDQHAALSLGELAATLEDPRCIARTLQACSDDELVLDVLALLRDDIELAAAVSGYGLPPMRSWDGVARPASAGPRARCELLAALRARALLWGVQKERLR